jgi:type VI secretion system secreted protein VgrG
MAMKPKQGKRRAEFDSPELGKDTLVLTRFDGREAMSELFEYQIEALSTTESIDFNKPLGKKCSVRINTTDNAERYFNGILTEAQSLGVAGKDGGGNDLFKHRLLLRPAFWLLARRVRSRIFHEKTVSDIIRQVLNEGGVTTEFRLGGYPVMKYCVQYNESDFAFASRLMEEYGIYYFFDHSKGDHKMVLADKASAHQPKENGTSLPFVAVADKHFQNKETLNEWSTSRRFLSGKFSLSDYNPATPSASMLSEKSGGGGYSNDKLEVFHYPGRFENKGEGQKLAGILLEAEQAADRRCEGAGDAVSCSPGRTISLDGGPKESDGKDFVILRCAHLYRAADYASGGMEEDSYLGRFEFLPKDVQFRSPQKTPKPRIFGPHTAKVVGEGEIDVDKDGMILAEFHWARELPDGDKTRRVRIAHGWAGKQWGDIKIPRVGMEVVVEFLDGDPDQPLVTGCVYHAENMPPYPLPSEKTISGTKSKTDGGSGYNEFVFDDKSGSELVRMHAERDMDGTIKNDERRKIGNDVKIEVGNNRTEDIGMQWKVTSGTKIEFICGQSKIEMTPGSIKIKSVLIEIEATGMLKEKGTVVQYESSGPMIVKGMPILLN